MAPDKIYVSVSLEADADEPVADLVYDGIQWASVTLVDDALEVTLYGSPGGKLPLDDAIASLIQARDRLLSILRGAGPPSSAE